jgi:hypothetical protein
MLFSCNKDNSGNNINTLKITEGEFNGYNHTFTPNLGFWSTTGQSARYVHLVLGDNDNLSNGGENKMSIVFYYTGTMEINFPSPEGQWIRFGINFDGIVYDFMEESAVLTVTQFDDFHFEGSLTGQFVDVNDSSRKISFTLNLSLPMQQL